VRSRVVCLRKINLAVKELGMQGPVARKRECSDSTDPLCKSDFSREARRQERCSVEMVASIKVGSPKLEGARAQRAGSGARRGHAEKTKGQWGRRSQQQYPLVTTPTEEIQEAKLRTRAPQRIESGLAGRQARRSAKAKVEVSGSWVLPGSPGG